MSAINHLPAPRASRITLLLGFGGLLAIIAVSGWDTLRVVDQVRRQEDQLRRQFVYRNRLLNNIRSELYLSGTYVRDYLLEPDPERAVGFGVSLSDVRHRMDGELASYASQMGQEETKQYSALRSELAEYWQLLDPLLKWNIEERKSHGYAFLRDEVFPRRTAMLEIAERIGEIEEQQVNAGNERASRLLDQFKTRLGTTLFLALGIGLTMAAFSMRKILQLESQTELRYRETEEARRQLTNLSARLVDAQEAERRSLSRELHDEVGQSLSAVILELRILATGISARTEEQNRGQIDLINHLVEDTIGVVRNMALLLRPSMLDDLGLIPALRWQAAQVSKRTGMNVTVVTDELGQLPDEHKTCIYRVVQEAVHNCSRHAQAANIHIRVERTPLKLRLTVQDDGKGFEPSKSKGLGLLGIEERAAQLGGKSQVQSQIGKGTVLSVELPLQSYGVPSTTNPSETNPHLVG